MSKYRVKPGYCLHLPHGCFANPGDEVDLAGDLEKEILERQGWKVELSAKHKPVKEAGEAQPELSEEKALDKPPKDRAVKGAKVK